MQVIPETPEKDWPKATSPSPKRTKTEDWVYPPYVFEPDTDDEEPYPKQEQKQTLYYAVNAVSPHFYVTAKRYEYLWESSLVFTEGRRYVGRIRCFPSKLPLIFSSEDVDDLLKQSHTEYELQGSTWVQVKR